MIPGRRYTPSDWLAAVWRRRWLPVVSCLVITTGTVVVVKKIPHRYRAEALILVEQRSVSPEYVRANVTTESVKDKLPTISQQIVSRTRLEDIVRKLHLYAEMRQVRPLDAVVEQMRRNIQVKLVEGSESFRVSYDSEDPEVAVRVTEQLVGPFIGERAQARAVMARDTSVFLQSQLEEARARLVEQEKRLEEYRMRYGAELPSQLQSNIQVIQNVQTQIQAIGDNLNRDRDRRLVSARQLADLQSEQFLPEAGPSPTTPAAGEVATENTPALQRLEAAVADVRSLELRLTAQHPDLVRARQLVDDLRARARSESAVASAVRKPTAAENARRNRIRELQAEIESLDRQVTDKLASQEHLRKELTAYRARVDALPTRESEIASLTRDYDTLQKVYQTLLAKNEESKISENLERQQVGGQYRIVDPPRRPQTPLGPDRRLMMLAGSAAGFGVGIAWAVLLQLLDKRLFTTADVLAGLSLPVVATIPFMPEDAERRTRRAWRVAELSMALAGLVILCAVAVWWRVRV